VKIRIVASAVALLAAILLSACGSTVAGSPQAAAVTGLPDTSVDLPTGPTTYPSDLPSDTDLPTETADTGAVTTDQSTTDALPTTDEPTTDEPTTDEPTTTAELPTDTGVPTGTDALPTGTQLPTSIPGLSPECNKIFGVISFFGNVLTQDTPVTQQQVDAAFAETSGLPSDVAADVVVLKDVATKMVGKSGTELYMVLGTKEASDAVTGLSTYMSSSCKYGG
jgi:hypothetical protein